MTNPIPEGWHWFTIKEIAAPEAYSLVGNTFGTRLKASEYIESGVPIIRGVNLSGPGNFNPEGATFVSNAKADELLSQNAIADDVIFTQQGSVGQVGLIPSHSGYDRWVVSQSQMKLRTNRLIALPLYVYLYFTQTHVVNMLKSRAIVTGVPHINLSILKEFPILLPSVSEQKAILDVIEPLDDKIELNRRMNATLEETARALFKSWFVDFDPVRAKMDDRQPDSMDAETAALFPDRLVESELGPIPEGWEVGTLSNLTQFVLGGDWGKDIPDLEYFSPAFCIRGADIPDLQNAGIGKLPLRYLKPSSLEKRILQAGDLVVEISGGSPTQSTGRPVLIRQEFLDEFQYPLICSNFCRLARLKNDQLGVYIYLWMLWLYSHDRLLQYETGTTGIKNFAFTLFSERQSLVIPPDVVQLSFYAIVRAIQAQQQLNGQQSRILADTRDTLLPKLLSGEVRVHGL